MPKGGARPGSGRPKGAVRRHHVVVEDPSALLPVEWMLAVLRDPESEPTRRDRMAEFAAPYIHARLGAVLTTHIGQSETTNNITNNTVNIYAVPRGAALDTKDGTITIEGAPLTNPDPIEPFTGTPALTDQSSEQTNKAPNGGMTRIEDPAPTVHAPDTSNVTRLKRPDEPGAMVQRVFDALDKRNAKRDPDPAA